MAVVYVPCTQPSVVAAALMTEIPRLFYNDQVFLHGITAVPIAHRNKNDFSQENIIALLELTLFPSSKSTTYHLAMDASRS